MASDKTANASSDEEGRKEVRFLIDGEDAEVKNIHGQQGSIKNVFFSWGKSLNSKSIVMF